MRKILSLVLVLALVLGSFPAFAAADQNQIAAKLKGYGVLIGDQTGDLMLDKVMTREQALVTLSRLMGVEDEAKATSVQSSFSDAGHSYYGPFIAYAELKGWTKGIGGGLFGFGQTVTVQQYMTFMLRALGYAETPYADTMKVAGELGLLKDMMNTEPNAQIKRGDAAVAMYNTLMTKPANNEIALVYVLGLEDTTSLVAEVKSVEAKNLKQLKVFLTAPIEKAGDEDNWKLKTDGDAVIDKDSDFALSEDGMVVTITLTDAAEQQEVVDLTVKGLLEDDITIEDIQFLDLTIPSAVEAQVIGIDTVKVIFSEPMTTATIEDTSNYAVEDVDGNKLYVKSVKAVSNNTAAWVELYADLSKDIEITVSGVKDFQGYAAPKVTLPLKVVVDTEKPYVVDYEKASPFAITLIFNEDIEAKESYTYTNDADEEVIVGDEDNLKKYYHTNSDDIPYYVKADGNKLILKFEEKNKLPTGTAYVYVAAKAVNDLWDNTNDKIVVEAKVVADTTAPEVKSIESKTQSTVKVTFSEDVAKGDDFELTLLKDDGNKPSVKVKSAAIDGDEMLVTFSDEIYGDFSLVFEAVEDAYGNEMAKTTVDFTMEDETSPEASDFVVTAYNRGTNRQFLVVDFKEKMNVDSITDKDNYWLTKLSGAEYVLEDNLDDSDIKFTVLNDGAKLKITIPKDDTGIDLTDSAYYLKIGRLKDAAGNKMTTFSANLTIVNGDLETVAHTAKLTDSKTVVITAEDRIVNLKVNEIKLYEGAITTDGALKVAKVRTSLNSSGDTVITFTLVDAVGTDASLVYTVTEDAGENEFGKELAYADTSYSVVDKAGPEVVDAFLSGTTTGSSIYVVFSEDIDGATLSKGTNGFTVTDGAISEVKLYASNVIEIVYDSEDDAFDLKTEFSYDGKNDIADADGNLVAEFEYDDDLKPSGSEDDDNPL